MGIIPETEFLPYSINYSIVRGEGKYYGTGKI